VRVRKEEVFANYAIPAEPGRVSPPTLTLKRGCNVGVPPVLSDP
jgi:hypothetical protein